MGNQFSDLSERRARHEQRQARIDSDLIARQEALHSQQESEQRLKESEERCTDLIAQLEDLVFQSESRIPAAFGADLFEDTGDVSLDDEERTYTISRIREEQQTLAIQEQNVRKQTLEEGRLRFEEVKLDHEISNLEFERDELKRRLDRAGKAVEWAIKAKARPYNPVHFQEGLIVELEKSIDVAEHRLTRARVDALQYALQREFSSYSVLKEENARREAVLLERERKVSEDTVKEDQIEKQIEKMFLKVSPVKDDTSELAGSPLKPITPSPARTPPVITKLRESRAEEERQKEEWLRTKNQELDDLIRTNQEGREEIQRQWEAANAKLRALQKDASAINRQKILLSNVSDRLENAKITEIDSSHKIAILKQARMALMARVKGPHSSDSFQDGIQRLRKQQEDQEEHAKLLRKRKIENDELQATVAELDRSVKELKDGNAKLEIRIAEASRKARQVLAHIPAVPI
jgi:hypothetical protein